MPIDAIASVTGALPDVLAPRLKGIPDSGLPELQGLGKGLEVGDGAPAGPTFGQVLQSAIGDVNRAQLHATDLSTRFAAGEAIDVHQVMIAAQEASVALNLAIQVRNKLVDGYQELMRVNV